MKKWIISLIVASLLLSGGFALATTQVRAESGETLTASSTAAALSDAQKQQVKELLADQKADTKALTDQRKEAVRQLKEALLGNPTDTAKLEQAPSQILSLEGQLLQSRINLSLQIKDVVGADQLGRIERRLGLEGWVTALKGEVHPLQGQVKRLEQRVKQWVGRKVGALPLPLLKQKLGLSETQVQQLKDLRTGTVSALKGLRQQLTAARKDLRQAILADTTDTAGLNQAQATIGTLRAQILQVEINAALEAKSIVGPEAFTKIARLFAFLKPGSGLF